MYINAPLLTCYVSEKYAEPADWNRLVKAWSILNRLRPADINIVLLTDYLTAGAHYSLRAEINLPTLWPSEGIKQLQKSFLELVQDIVGIPEEDVFNASTLLQEQIHDSPESSEKELLSSMYHLLQEM